MSCNGSWKKAVLLILPLLALPLVLTGCKPKTDQVQEEVQVIKRDAPADNSAVPAVGTPAETAPAAEAADATGTVVELKGAAAFDAFIQSAPVVVTDFCATWCGPCQKLAPILGKMAKAYAKDGVKFASFDVDENREICERLGVSGIPDVRIFVKGVQVAQTTGNMPQEIMMNLEEALKSVAASGSVTTAAPVPADDAILNSGSDAAAPAEVPAQ